MKNVLFLLLGFLFSLSASATSLWCAFSAYGLTPSDAAQLGVTPYQTAQVDVLNSSLIQVDISDEYGDGAKSRVLKAAVNREFDLLKNGFYFGTYNVVVDHSTESVAVSNVEGKYKLVVSGTEFNCDLL